MFLEVFVEVGEVKTDEFGVLVKEEVEAAHLSCEEGAKCIAAVRVCGDGGSG